MSAPPVADGLKALGSLLFLAVFVAAWGDLLLDFRDFSPTPDASPPVPRMPVDDFRVGVLGTLATTLAAAVGALYGVKAAAAEPAHLGLHDDRTPWQRVRSAIRSGAARLARAVRDVRFIGGLSTAVYLGFGVTVLLMTLGRSAEAPEVMTSFAGSALAFLGALFTAATTRRPG
ncbi:hypothetical protein [Nocardioides sp. cx-173]|uniref:hypothetical protein n=1 Tax=Nocardioides sp. cx-173 TaxID=2898796 RepID=UPI001E5EA6EF|nr:hypothetical protein [Nocardioides sp. cx-173]MCD4526155.1 hypothetical protein [Nocardioides sp. cx-173]UGB40629.1 hypothetical protein LQ940_14750 [Nocardioides sp. cx-173]